MSARIPGHWASRAGERVLGAAVGTTAVLYLLAALSRPAYERGVSASIALVTASLLAVHACIYVFGGQLEGALRPTTVVGANAGTLVVLAAVSPSVWLNIAVFAAFTTLVIARHSLPYSPNIVRLLAIVVFATSTAVGFGVYRGSAIAFVLSIVFLLGQAVVLTGARNDLSDGTRIPTVADTERSAIATVEDSAKQASLVEAGPASTPLTGRELDVLRLAAQGMKSADIALSLGITERTVKAHLAAAYRRLGVTSRAAAIARAATRGLL